MNRKTLAVTEATVAANLHQAGDVLPALTTQVTLDRVVSIDVIANLCDFLFSEVADTRAGVNANLSADLGSGRTANAIKIGKSDLDTLLAREVYTVNTGQFGAPLLALALLVARVLADDVNLAMATDDLALVAHLLYRRTYLHCNSFRLFPYYVIAQPQA
jgi:hypothetical protein